jgi:predicted nucleotidyltransferase
MADDRETFRRRAEALTIYPEGTADAVLEASDDPVWSFVVVYGSTARGDGTRISDIDLYAEPLDASRDRDHLHHVRNRMLAYNVDLLVPEDGSHLSRRLAEREPFALQLLREALVLRDAGGAFAALRTRYLEPGGSGSATS